MTWLQWEGAAQKSAERYLTWRKRRRLARKEKQKKKNPILDWLDAIVSAVIIVLIINQYLLQAYQIPSQSMVPTLLISDRIFVNKLVYGPELIPGMIKLPGFRVPQRGDVIIFESPEYISQGPLKDILQRVVYMVTLSLVDIDRDEYGLPKHHFLIKRAIGMPGDRIRVHEGDVEILTPGEDRWKPESAIAADLGLAYPRVRTFTHDEYPFFKDAGIGLARELAGLGSTEDQKKAISRYYRMSRDSAGNLNLAALALNDGKYVDLWRYRAMWELDPSNSVARDSWRELEEGVYIPEDRFFPMGDNRDDSKDARYFGAVRIQKVLGRALIRYWPITRFGLVR